MIGSIDDAPVSGDVFPPGLRRVTYTNEHDGSHDWALALPGDSSTWAVNLHGHGSHGDQLYTRQDIRDRWLPEFISAGVGILTPNLRGNAWMNDAAVSDLHALIGHIRDACGGERFVFFGGSMGGAGNLIYAIRHPEDVHGVIALGAVSDIASFWQWAKNHHGTPSAIAKAIADAYGGTPDERPSAYEAHSVIRHHERLSMPVFLAHGAVDAVMPVSQARQLAEVKYGDARFMYHELPIGDHDAPLLCDEAFSFFHSLCGIT
ncbi:MAG: alpha/beta fold hydrolase [Spirochaetota bacterium]